MTESFRETIAYIYVNNGRGLKEAVELLNTAIVIDETCPKVIPPLIYINNRLKGDQIIYDC